MFSALPLCLLSTPAICAVDQHSPARYTTALLLGPERGRDESKAGSVPVYHDRRAGRRRDQGVCSCAGEIEVHPAHLASCKLRHPTRAFGLSLGTKTQAIDAAKKRALAQRVDYDTFKNMVRATPAAAAAAAARRRRRRQQEAQIVREQQQHTPTYNQCRCSPRTSSHCRRRASHSKVRAPRARARTRWGRGRSIAFFLSQIKPDPL